VAETPETHPFRILFKDKFVPILVVTMTEYEEYVLECFEKEAEEIMKKWGIKESV
jgi:hypothetical protein